MESLIVILLSLLFSAFFSGMEIAFVSSNKLMNELEKQKGNFQGKIIKLFSENPTRYIATMLVGNNIALVIYGITMAEVLDPVIKNYIVMSETGVLVIQTIISTLLILITAEFLPKAVFRMIPNITLNIFSFPAAFFYFSLGWFVRLVMMLSNFILKTFFKLDTGKKATGMAFEKVDLDNFIEQSKSPDDLKSEYGNEIKIFQNVLDFSDVKLKECMVPRTEIEAIEINDSLDNLRKIFIETGYSKVLVYKENHDNIVGYVHSSELFKSPKKIKNCMFDVIYVPESMQAGKLLSSFIQEQKNVAVVVDEFGGTAGMVTGEDIIEEIIGEIEDEHDTDELTEKQINEYEFIFSGRHEVDHLNEKYNFNLPESDEYETLAGLILFHNEDIPIESQILTIENQYKFTFKILKVSETKIELVKLEYEELE